MGFWVWNTIFYLETTQISSVQVTFQVAIPQPGTEHPLPTRVWSTARTDLHLQDGPRLNRCFLVESKVPQKVEKYVIVVIIIIIIIICIVHVGAYSHLT